MAVEDMMLELAWVRAVENQCYVVMSSFIRKYDEMDFIGNAAVIEPNFKITRYMRTASQFKVPKHSSEEGIIESEVNIGYIRDINEKYPIQEL